LWAPATIKKSERVGNSVFIQLVGFCYNKKQSLLETMLPLSSWSPAAIKNQSELKMVLSLNLWISAMITNESE
jgi:hypothetical protein